MNPSELSKIQSRLPLSRSTLARNSGWTSESVASAAFKESKPRIRQSQKPLMNKLEQDWFSVLARGWFEQYNVGCLRAQALRFKIASGGWYKPDMTGIIADMDGKQQMAAWECKGMNGKNIDRGKLALKVAANQWPEVAFFLVWKDCNGWQTQRILA